MLFVIPFDELNFRVGPTRQPQVVQRFGVDWEETHRRPVLGGHVADRRSVGELHGRHARAEELDELADDPFLPQDLRHGQHEISRRRAGRELADQLEADDFRQQHVERLAKHHGLGLDPTDTPADDPEAVDHRRVAVGADECVGDGDQFTGASLRSSLGHPAQENALGEEFEIHLMHDADVWRHDAEIVEGLLAPAEEFITFTVAFEFQLDVEIERIGRAEAVDLHGMIDHQIDRNQRIDLFRIAAQALHGAAHGGQIDDAGHSSEVL